jgi:hypothetical protein
MDWTFGITTKEGSESITRQVISSIYDTMKHSPGRFEILVIGGRPIYGDNLRHIEFHEPKGPGRISRKKNLLAFSARFENIVLAHDYIGFDSDWASGFEIFGGDWNLSMNRVEDIFGRRFYDWVSWDSPSYAKYAPIPYSKKDHTSFQFVPGAYWVAKTQFMLDHPLNEELLWGESEDIEWSLRVRTKGLAFNPYSKVRHLKRHRGFKYTRSINDDGFQICARPDYLNWEPI